LHDSSVSPCSHGRRYADPACLPTRKSAVFPQRRAYNSAASLSQIAGLSVSGVCSLHAACLEMGLPQVAAHPLTPCTCCTSLSFAPHLAAHSRPTPPSSCLQMTTAARGAFLIQSATLFTPILSSLAGSVPGRWGWQADGALLMAEQAVLAGCWGAAHSGVPAGGQPGQAQVPADL